MRVDFVASYGILLFGTTMSLDKASPRRMIAEPELAATKAQSAAECRVRRRRTSVARGRQLATAEADANANNTGFVFYFSNGHKDPKTKSRNQ